MQVPLLRCNCDLSQSYGVLLCRSRGVVHEAHCHNWNRPCHSPRAAARSPCLHWTHNFGVFHEFRCVHPQKLRSQGPDLVVVRPTLQCWRRQPCRCAPWMSGILKKIIAGLGPRSDLCVVVVTTSPCSKGEGCCFLATRPRDVSDVRHEDGTNLIRDGARHHSESWHGGRSTPVSAGEFCMSMSSSKAPRSTTLPSKTNTSCDA